MGWNCHSSRDFAAALALSYEMVRSGSYRGTVRLWEAATGKEMLPTFLHRGVVQSVAFSPDGKRVATGCWSSPGWVKTWDAGR